MKKCPCGSKESFENCCQRYHYGLAPENALKLMKARYSAYATKDLTFIFNTLHPHHPSSKQSFEEFAKSSRYDNTSFNKLEILDFQEKGDLATVTFTAHLSVGDLDATFTEKSQFEKIDNRWLYKSGEVKPGKAVF